MLRKGPAEQDIKEVLYSAEDIRLRVTSLADTIVMDYQDKEQAPILIAVLMGSVHFFSDLMRAIGTRMHVEPDFMVVKSYDGTHSSGTVKILIDLRASVADRDVIVVEDIVDTGSTMKSILDILGNRHPSSIRTCVLLDKPSTRQIEVPIDYVGFEVPNLFVVGYGLDYNEAYRQLPFIGVLKEEIYL